MSYHELIECVEQLVVPIPTTLLIITTLGGGVQLYSLVSSTLVSSRGAGAGVRFYGRFE